jgi:arabinose-5-phosphate isomerase
MCGMVSPDGEILARGRRILEEEAGAVLRKSRQLGAAFAAMVRRILAVEGHVAVTGVGKSGIVGAKIAATLSSTGTPAFFLNAIDALHGDLGALSPRDVLLAISASGETSEVLAVAEAAKHLGVEILALTGALESSLGRLASLALDAGVEREACPLGLAPTASSTVTLAMGDALAMVLLEERGFTREKYLRFHPGGSLGERLRLRVADLMRQGDQVPRVAESATFAEALEEMTRRDNIGLTLVVSAAGKLTGIITDGDLRRLLRQAGERTDRILARTAGSLMTRNPRLIDPDASAAEALRIMEVRGITSLAVVDHHDQPAGLIHLHDILGRGKILL